MAFGFSVDKLGLLEGLGGNKVLASHYVGLVAAATGLGIAAAAGIRFMRQRTAIETSEFRPRYLADVVIAVSAAVGGVAAMTQLVLSR